jgi:hypothetical protein
MRTIAANLEDLLSLIHCAEDYGYNRSVFYGSIGDIVEYVTDDEIEEYAQTFLTQEARSQGYNEEDYDSAIDTLTEWRDRYCGNEPEVN